MTVTDFPPFLDQPSSSFTHQQRQRSRSGIQDVTVDAEFDALLCVCVCVYLDSISGVALVVVIALAQVVSIFQKRYTCRVNMITVQIDRGARGEETW